jgi:oligopeptide/dipeptide ABC transporter ATP-binding protein
MSEAAASADGAPVLSIRDLVTKFVTPDGVVTAVDHVSYDVYAGETLGVVGESGSGKTVTVMSAMGLLEQPPARIPSGEVIFEGQDLRQMPDRELREIRGARVGMIFQDPMASLNPVFKVGAQLNETLRVHQPGLSRRGARSRAVELLDAVGIAEPAARYDQYPNQFSGGMRQRVMIALAMANGPRLIIADEPTTALDVTIQAQVLEVLDTARRETHASVVLITHDLGIIAERADQVVVMYAGRVVETADVISLFAQPLHPYTKGLLASRPDMTSSTRRLSSIPGSPPSLLGTISGCPFRDRCSLSRGRERCVTERPALRSFGGGHRSACHFAEELVPMPDTVRTEAPA